MPEQSFRHGTGGHAQCQIAADSRSSRGGILPWALLVVGSVASLAANVAVAEPTATGRVIAAWPSFALIAAYELLMRQVRRSAADGGKPLCAVASVLALGASALRIGMICCRLLLGAWLVITAPGTSQARDTGSRPSAAACFTAMIRSRAASQPRLETARRGVDAAWRAGREAHGWYVSPLAVLVSPGLLAWVCGRRLPRDC